MAMTRVLSEFGLGTSLRRLDYTAAAVRAVEDALWRNSINVAEVFGAAKEDMLIEVEIGVQAPDRVDPAAILPVFPYGRPVVTVVRGGLDVPRDGGGATVIANAVISVSLDLVRS